MGAGETQLVGSDSAHPAWDPGGLTGDPGVNLQVRVTNIELKSLYKVAPNGLTDSDGEQEDLLKDQPNKNMKL
ncbi:hypothetical protein GN956_G25774 [Arapaima gigas]